MKQTTVPNITFGYHVGLSQSTFPAESVTKEITRVNFKLNNVKERLFPLETDSWRFFNFII